MISENLKKILLETTAKALESKVKSFELTDEDGDPECYFITENTGFGFCIIEIEDDIRQIEKKDAKEIKKICSAKRSTVNWYENFGEWVIKVRIEL